MQFYISRTCSWTHLFSRKTDSVCINTICTKAHLDKMPGKTSAIPRMTHRKHLVRGNKSQILSLGRQCQYSVIISKAVKKNQNKAGKWHSELSFPRNWWAPVLGITDLHGSHIASVPTQSGTKPGTSRKINTGAGLHKMLASHFISDLIQTV